MVCLYVFIPPSRGLEIRTLEVLANGYDFDRTRFKDRNAMLMKEDGVVLYSIITKPGVSEAGMN